MMQGFEEAEARAICLGAGTLGTPLPTGAAEPMARHLSLVYEENERSNLTRIPRNQAVALHVLDSLAGLPMMRNSPKGPWLDLGSGAGFPGIVLSIAAERRVDLLESVGKKARFLGAVCRELCLDGTVLGQRAEEAALVHGGAYSGVCARAVSELPALVELAAPLLMAGGVLVCWKGEPDDAEWSRSDAVARLVGMRHRGTVPVRIPGLEARRCLVMFEKVGRSTIALPRRIGLAQSHPLA